MPGLDEQRRSPDSSSELNGDLIPTNTSFRPQISYIPHQNRPPARLPCMLKQKHLQVHPCTCNTAKEQSLWFKSGWSSPADDLLHFFGMLPEPGLCRGQLHLAPATCDVTAWQDGTLFWPQPGTLCLQHVIPQDIKNQGIMGCACAFVSASPRSRLDGSAWFVLGLSGRIPLALVVNKANCGAGAGRKSRFSSFKDYRPGGFICLSDGRSKFPVCPHTQSSAYLLDLSLKSRHFYTVDLCKHWAYLPSKKIIYFLFLQHDWAFL